MQRCQIMPEQLRIYNFDAVALIMLENTFYVNAQVGFPLHNKKSQLYLHPV